VQVERCLSDELSNLGRDVNVFELLERVERNGLLDSAKKELRERIRKDTEVTLHLRGANGGIKTFDQIFGRNSSFLNRLLTYLLYRSGAFALEFSELEKAVARHDVPALHVLCRHGARTIDQLSELFSDFALVEPKLAKLKERQGQHPSRLWAPGVFRHYL
jgi:hypothetical protein